MMKEPIGTPCGECPWRRKSWGGFLGPHSAEEWVAMAHADGFIACHKTIDGHRPAQMIQCSGAAIYRSNVCKIPNTGAARLPADRDGVFASPTQFTEHHNLRSTS